MPSSSSSNAFARRVSRVSAFPSRTSAMRSSRVLGSRKPPRIMSTTRIASPGPGKPFFANRWNRGIVGDGVVQREAEDSQGLAAISGEGLDQRRLGDFPVLLDFGELGRVAEPPAEISSENADQNAE